MSQEHWRTASGNGGGSSSGRFVTPQVYDQDDEREKMTVTKAVGVFVTFVLGVLAGLAFFSFFVRVGLDAVGVSVSWVDALVASLSFIALRYFDFGIVTNLRRKRD